MGKLQKYPSNNAPSHDSTEISVAFWFQNVYGVWDFVEA
jgi:hypothetical protein